MVCAGHYANSWGNSNAISDQTHQMTKYWLLIGDPEPLPENWRETMKYIPVNEFTWTEDYSFHRYMTCANHNTALYMTKNPHVRSMHILRYPEDTEPFTECECPFEDLRVICEDDGAPVGFREMQEANKCREEGRPVTFSNPVTEEIEENEGEEFPEELPEEGDEE